MFTLNVDRVIDLMKGIRSGYTRFMLKTYGEDIVDLLESMKKPYKWTDGELEILIKDIKDKTEEL